VPTSPARSAAFDILLRVEQQDAYASDLLHSSRCTRLSPADRALATELVMGTLRWRSVLDAAITQFSSQPLAKLDPEVRMALRMAAYQLGWLQRVPARAAIHESVELVKRARKRSAAPFANAILRKLPDVLSGCQQQMELLQSADSAEMLASHSAHPEWLVKRWFSEFGLDTARAICSYDQSVPPTAVRLQTPAVEDVLRREGIELAPGRLLTSARRVVSGDITRTKAFADRHALIQDEASQLVAAILGTGTRILDCCSAPGGKTLAIADRNPDAEITAVELHAHRAERLRQRVATSNVSVITGDVTKLSLSGKFDRVLADVPCSGTGTLARHPEIKWRLQAHDLDDLAARQTAILESAMRTVQKGGRLVYSTCSLEHEENASIIERALQANPSFRLLDGRLEMQRLHEQGEVHEIDSLLSGPYVRTLPGRHPCDGFFIAILQKI
jgi:16S rRNA (cytosine967-C5)-methyltransferase